MVWRKLKRYLQPPVFESPEHTAQARNVHIFLLCLQAVLVVALVARFFQYPDHIARYALVLFAVTVLLTPGYVLNRLGHSTMAAAFVLWGAYGLLILLARSGGGIHSIGTFWLVALAIIGGALFQKYGWVYSAGAAAAASLMVAVGQARGFFPEAPVRGPLSIWQGLLTVIVFGAAVQHFSGVVMRRTLHQSRQDLDREAASARESRAKAARLRLAAEVSGMGVWQYEPGTGIVTAEDRTLRLFGFEPEEHAGGITDLELWRTHVLEEDWPKLDRQLRGLAAGDARMDGEFRVRRSRDKAIRLMRTSAVSIPGEHKATAMIVGITLDITEERLAFDERRRMVNELAERVRELTLLRQVARFLQTARRSDNDWFAELIGMIPPASRYPDACAVRLTFEDEIISVGDWVEGGCRAEAVFSVGGRPGILELLYAVDSDTAVSMRPESELLASIVDMLQVYLTNERAQLARRQRDEEFRALFESTKVAIALISPEGHLLSWNPAFRDFVGYPDSELTGMLLESLSPAVDAKEEREAFRAVVKGERASYEGERRYVAKDGRELWGAFSISMVPASGYAMAMVQDITERKNALAKEERLENQLRQSQKLQALGTLSGGIAHDFNNILTAVAGAARVTRNQLGSGHEALRNIELIESAVGRAASLVQQILTFGRQQEAKRQAVQIQDVIQEAIALVRATLPARIELSEVYAPTLPLVAADPVQIHQILLNLATNSAFAMGAAGGTLSVEVSPVRLDGQQSPGMQQLKPGQYVRISVSDSGVGMDKDVLDRIFEPFFTTKPAGAGSGLGLSVVLGIVENHNGGITVYSEPGRGSTFRVYLPVTGAAAPQTTAIEPKHQPVTGARVLFIDDEQMIMGLMSELLSQAGYQVSAFTDPQAALDSFKQRPNEFDVLVTDASMPHLSGINLARAALAERPDLPIVLVSGHFTPAETAEAREVGVREILHKPHSVDELEAVLAAVLGSHVS